MSQTLAFVGVGRMGANMARRLKDCGYQITAVYDVHCESAEALAAEIGSQACTKLADVTAAADVIFTVVTNDEAMRQIFFGGEDNLFMGATGKIFINCATVSPGVHREVWDGGDKVGAHTLEASMASSISHAREGKLYLMMAGDESVYNQMLPMLEQMSVNRRFIGGAGRAAEIKALVNMVMNINTAGLAEGLGLAAALGHNLDLVREVFSQTGANSRVLETDAADMVAREHDCWFSAEHAAKDSGIAQHLAQEAGLNLPLNNATQAQYSRMVELGLGGLDKSGIAELTFKGRHA
ncbi:MAG: NAD(P)-dependent oxidoreductase [Verrucomicrobiales bacterium]|nr:NAD(P)-dependent oxidoreductase [Verrucomicrobiales bacterium]MCP5558431.1 NAD(P)-dependent oxidoreductase [Verrucomicrobiaceae bacterium]